MQYLSEDYCILNHSPQIWAYSIYNSAKIEDKTLEWFPELMSYVDNTQRAMNDKAFFFHHKFQPEKILLSCPIKALITLKIENIEESWMEPIQSDAMLGPLSVSTMWQLTHTGPVVFKHLKKITEILPCYQLHLGRNLTQIPPLIKNLL